MAQFMAENHSKVSCGQPLNQDRYSTQIPLPPVNTLLGSRKPCDEHGNLYYPGPRTLNREQQLNNPNTGYCPGSHYVESPNQPFVNYQGECQQQTNRCQPAYAGFQLPTGPNSNAFLPPQLHPPYSSQPLVTHVQRQTYNNWAREEKSNISSNQEDESTISQSNLEYPPGSQVVPNTNFLSTEGCIVPVILSPDGSEMDTMLMNSSRTSFREFVEQEDKRNVYGHREKQWGSVGDKLQTTVEPFPSHPLAGDYDQFIAQSDVQEQSFDSGNRIVEHMETNSAPSESETVSQASRRQFSGATPARAPSASQPIPRVKGGQIAKRVPVKDQTEEEIPKRGKGAPPKDQEERRKKAEESISLLSEERTKKNADTLVTCETHLRYLLKKEAGGKRSLEQKLRDNKCLTVDVYYDDRELLLLLAPENREELEKWQKSRLADFTYIRGLSTNSKSKENGENKKKEGKLAAIKSGEEAKNIFNFHYKDTSQHFLNGEACQNFRERWESIKKGIEKCGKLSVEECAHFQLDGNATQRFRIKQRKQTREGEKKREDYEKLTHELKLLRDHMGLTWAAPNMGGSLDSTGVAVESTLSRHEPNTNQPESYQRPAPRQENDHRPNNCRIVPVRGRIGDETDEQQDAPQIPMHNVPSMKNFTPIQQTNQSNFQLLQAQICFKTASEVIETLMANLPIDANGDNFLENWIRQNCDQLVILKSTTVNCQVCRFTNDPTVEKVFFVDEYPNNPITAQDYLPNIYNTGFCPRCKSQTKSKKVVSQNARASFTLLKHPPEHFLFPREEEHILGEPHVPIFFIQETEAGLIPWKKYNEWWMAAAVQSKVPGTPPPNCANIPWLLFQKKTHCG